MEPDNVFGDLRAMSRQAPSEKSFLAIVRALDGLFERAPDEAASRVLPFAVDALRGWPDEVRVLEFSDATNPDILPKDGRLLAIARRLLFTCPQGRYDRRGVLDDARVIAMLDAASAGEIPLDLAELHLDADAYRHLVGAFVDLPALRRVRRLSWTSSGRSTSPLTAFASAPWAPTVEEVFMDGRGATSDEQALLAARPFGALSALDAPALDVMALEGLYPELTHLRIPAGPGRDYATQRFEDAFPALTSLTLDGVEDAPAALLALGEVVVRRLRALRVFAADRAYYFVSTRNVGASPELVQWCTHLERVDLIAGEGSGFGFEPDERPLAWLDEAPLEALTLTPFSTFDVEEFFQRRARASLRELGCILIEREGAGPSRPTAVRVLSVMNSCATSPTVEEIERGFPELERLTLVLMEMRKFRSTPQQLERSYSRGRAAWMSMCFPERLDAFTLSANRLGFSSEEIIELYRRVERSGMTRFDVAWRGFDAQLDAVFRGGSIPYARVRWVERFTDGLASWRRR